MNADQLTTLFLPIIQGLIACEPCAPGVIRNSPLEGVIPRGFHVETDIRDETARKIIFIGQNPAYSHGNNETAEIRKANGDRPAAWCRWQEHFRDTVRNTGYFSAARKIVDELGERGIIVWSDFYKCENFRKSDNGVMFPAPAHLCSAKFLVEELRIAQETWDDNYLVVALGHQVHLYLTYSPFKEYIPKMLGIYHTSGHSKGGNQRFFGDQQIQNKIIQSMQENWSTRLFQHKGKRFLEVRHRDEITPRQIALD